MTPEQAAAMERLKADRYNDNTIYEGIDHTKERDADRKTLADAFIAERDETAASDDSEYADSLWLIATLKSPHLDQYLWIRRVFALGKQTRGEVKAVCKALKIELSALTVSTAGGA